MQPLRVKHAYKVVVFALSKEKGSSFDLYYASFTPQSGRTYIYSAMSAEVL